MMKLKEACPQMLTSSWCQWIARTDVSPKSTKYWPRGNYGKFDVIIIDGLFRFQMIDIAMKAMADSGAIICDDADGYGFYEGFKDSGLNRVDFFGYSPGVILPHCSSIFFGNGSFLFEPQHLIPVIANQ